MSLHRITAISVFLSLALSLGAEAFAQKAHIGDIQLFRPAEITEYGDEPHSNRGFYFGVDYLGWVVSRPDTALVGANIRRTVFNFAPGDGEVPAGGGNAIQGSDFNTGGFEARYNSGERIEFGYIDETGAGWGVSTFILHGPTTFLYGSNVSVLFNDPQNLNNGFVDLTGPDGLPDGFDDDLNGNLIFGRNGRDTDVPPDGEPDSPAPTDNGDRVTFPMTYRFLRVSLKTSIYGTDVQRTWRTASSQFGGWIEWGVGARYLNVNEKFRLEGFGGILDETKIQQTANNNAIGPQFAIRWFNMSYRWMYSADLKLTPAINFVTLQQNAVIGSNLTPGAPNQPLGLGPQGAASTIHTTEFSPIVELRLGVGYKVTDYINARLGFNCIYADGINRTPGLINYTIPGMGMLPVNGPQALFMTGISAGIEINR